MDATTLSCWMMKMCFFVCGKTLPIHTRGLFLLCATCRLSHLCLMTSLHVAECRLICLSQISIRSFFLMFLPLHHFTIYDLFRTQHGRHKDESWPMCPFRLWQIQLSLIYASSSINKWLATDAIWTRGTAIYWITAGSQYYPGFVNPELFFNRAMPLKVLTWLVLFMESTCWLSIWFDEAKADIIGFMIVLHVTLDIFTNRLASNWLLIAGWMVFMVQPDYLPPLNRRRFLRRKTQFYLQPPHLPSGLWGVFLQLWVFSLPLILVVDTLPSRVLMDLGAQDTFENSRSNFLNPFLHSVGIWQETWYLYKVEPFAEVSYFQAFVQLQNGSVVDRRSPLWHSQSWWERKQSTRLIKFFAKLHSSNKTKVSYCEYLAKDMNAPVTGVELVRLVSACLVWFGCVGGILLTHSLSTFHRHTSGNNPSRLSLTIIGSSLYGALP